jgi:hypothetical protein
MFVASYSTANADDATTFSYCIWTQNVITSPPLSTGASARVREAAAILYSLSESAKRAGVEPGAYLDQAIRAAVRQQPIPLPHQVVAAASA